MNTPLLQKSILIVDDEPTTLEILCLLMRKKCSEVHGALNGHLALDFLSIHQVDVVLTDLSMPQMDGLKLAQSIKERFPDTFLTGMTAYSEQEVNEEMDCHNFDHILYKPITREMLDSFVDFCQKTESPAKREELPLVKMA